MGSLEWPNSPVSACRASRGFDDEEEKDFSGTQPETIAGALRPEPIPDRARDRGPVAVAVVVLIVQTGIGQVDWLAFHFSSPLWIMLGLWLSACSGHRPATSRCPSLLAAPNGAGVGSVARVANDLAQEDHESGRPAGQLVGMLATIVPHPPT